LRDDPEGLHVHTQPLSPSRRLDALSAKGKSAFPQPWCAPCFRFSPPGMLCRLQVVEALPKCLVSLKWMDGVTEVSNTHRTTYDHVRHLCILIYHVRLNRRARLGPAGPKMHLCILLNIPSCACVQYSTVQFIIYKSHRELPNHCATSDLAYW
jgi:hypothetical protein